MLLQPDCESLAEFIHCGCHFVLGLHCRATCSMQCSPQCVHSKPVMHKQGDARQHVRTAGAWRGLDRQALEGCLGVVALALGVVMAGTGHLPTLKLLRGGSEPFLAPIIPSFPPPQPLPSTPPPLFPLTSNPPNCLTNLCHVQCTLWSCPLPPSRPSASYLLLLSAPSHSHLSPCHVLCLQDPCCLFLLASIHLAIVPYPPALHILTVPGHCIVRRLP